MTVVVQAGNNYYTGHGYGINLADNNNALSMTGGYCGVTNENRGRNVEWEYDPWSKEFVVSGYGAITNSTSGIAPDIIKDDIESLIISSGITGIGSLAFSGWTSLNSTTFDGCSLTTAANDAFDGCTSMAYGSVTVNGQNPFARIETSILSVVTNGILNGEGNLDLGVQQQGDSFLWQGGTFGDYDLGEMLLEGVSFNATKQWTTYYSPMNLAMPDGVRAFVVDNFDDYGVEITEVYYIPAGVGVLLYCDNAYDNITTDIYNGYTTSYSSLLEGAFYDMTLDQDEGYILYKNEFILSKGGSLPAYRCYLPAGNRYNARGLSARLSLTKPSGNSNATEITDIPKDTKADDNDSWYTINGHKLSEQPTQKGVYIHNGRKVVVK